MPATAVHPSDTHTQAPRLRLLPRREPSGAAHAAPLPVLVAGADPDRRAGVLEELSGRMPAGTSFEQAQTSWEVLERAPASRIVILSGDLEELSAETIAHVLASRHPGLPVISYGPA